MPSKPGPSQRTATDTPFTGTADAPARPRLAYTTTAHGHRPPTTRNRVPACDRRRSRPSAGRNSPNVERHEPPSSNRPAGWSETEAPTLSFDHRTSRSPGGVNGQGALGEPRRWTHVRAHQKRNTRSQKSERVRHLGNPRVPATANARHERSKRLELLERQPTGAETTADVQNATSSPLVSTASPNTAT